MARDTGPGLARGSTARGRGATRSPGWALAVILTLICVVAGLVPGRPGTVALAVPFALLALSGRDHRTGARSGTEPLVLISTDRHLTRSTSTLRLLLTPRPKEEPTKTLAAPSLVAITLAAPGCPADGLVLQADEECPLVADIPVSGEIAVLSYGSAGVSADVVRPTDFVQAPPVRVSVLPQVGPTLARPVSRRLSGLSGSHTSRRPGEGGELRSIAPMQPGDQQRRIDWRATARRSTDQDMLMVRRTFADAEASVVLVVDRANDLPASTEDWFAAGTSTLGQGSLHVARTAAATVAASYLAAGDRVGLDDLSGTRRPLRSAAGSRQLEQIRTRLAGMSVVPRRRHRRDPVPPQGAVVIIFSAFLDEEPARLLRLWHAQGHPVIGVDCVPVLQRTESSRAQDQTVRLTLLRRRLLLEDLQTEGITVLSGSVQDEPGRQSEREHGAPLPDAAGTDLDTGLRLLARQSRRGAGLSAAPGTARGIR
ncbi:DUF58 domain-containing protein [Arthrobacter echini]|uniref:DUF58 domain-containing protein n=1 Tax=Arthrobacter echini TaxID=1529066 RepID=A0A4S5E3Y8_9MICC|nr:DUF58 domain-containing protein [Arthrobacter echini]THJ66175.1 DUF58 domain-containing protein [Arthrobacter echini]